MTAAPTMPAPSKRPTGRRRPGSCDVPSLVMRLPSEEAQPKHERHEDDEARVDEGRGAHVRIEAGTDEEPPCQQRGHDPDQRAQHPRWEERPDNVDLGSHRAYRVGRGVSGDWPVRKASAAEASKSWSLVSSSMKRARLSSR